MDYVGMFNEWEAKRKNGLQQSIRPSASSGQTSVNKKDEVETESKPRVRKNFPSTPKNETALKEKPAKDLKNKTKPGVKEHETKTGNTRPKSRVRKNVPSAEKNETVLNEQNANDLKDETKPDIKEDFKTAQDVPAPSQTLTATQINSNTANQQPKSINNTVTSAPTFSVFDDFDVFDGGADQDETLRDTMSIDSLITDTPKKVNPDTDAVNDSKEQNLNNEENCVHMMYNSNAQCDTMLDMLCLCGTSKDSSSLGNNFKDKSVLCTSVDEPKGDSTEVHVQATNNTAEKNVDTGCITDETSPGESNKQKTVYVQASDKILGENVGTECDEISPEKLKESDLILETAEQDDSTNKLDGTPTETVVRETLSAIDEVTENSTELPKNTLANIDDSNDGPCTEEQHCGKFKNICNRGREPVTAVESLKTAEKIEDVGIDSKDETNETYNEKFKHAKEIVEDIVFKMCEKNQKENGVDDGKKPFVKLNGNENTNGGIIDALSDECLCPKDKPTHIRNRTDINFGEMSRSKGNPNQQDEANQKPRETREMSTPCNSVDDTFSQTKREKANIKDCKCCFCFNGTKFKKNKTSETTRESPGKQRSRSCLYNQIFVGFHPPCTMTPRVYCSCSENSVDSIEEDEMDCNAFD